jgi:hypothetical protein
MVVLAMAEAALVRVFWSRRLPRLWLRPVAYALSQLRLQRARLDVGSEIDQLSRYAEFTAREVK